MKPFVKSNKNDFVDAETIAEAVERKNMRFVPMHEEIDLLGAVEDGWGNERFSNMGTILINISENLIPARQDDANGATIAIW